VPFEPEDFPPPFPELGVVVPSSGLPVAVNFTVDANFGIDPVKLLFETSRTCRPGKEAKLSGMEPVKLLSFRYKVLNDVRFVMAGEIVPTKPCFPKFTFIIFFCESQVMKLQLSHASLPCQELASLIGYPNAAATSSNIVTCESQGPGVLMQ